jgi:FixJ family two-component response regulator
MPGFNALAAIELLRTTGLDLPLIIVSGTIGEDVAVATMKAGAHDYLMKGNLALLAPAVERELREAVDRGKHKLIEEKLLASEIRYRRLFESAKDRILILHAKTGAMVDVNPAVAEQPELGRDTSVL